MDKPSACNTPPQRPNSQQLEWAIATVEADREGDGIGQAATFLLHELIALRSETAARQDIPEGRGSLPAGALESGSPLDAARGVNPGGAAPGGVGERCDDKVGEGLTDEQFAAAVQATIAALQDGAKIFGDCPAGWRDGAAAEQMKRLQRHLLDVVGDREALLDFVEEAGRLLSVPKEPSDGRTARIIAAIATVAPSAGVARSAPVAWWLTGDKRHEDCLFFSEKWARDTYAARMTLTPDATLRVEPLSVVQSAKLRSDDWHDELLLRWCEWTGGHLSDQNFLRIIHDIVNDNLLPGSMRAPDSRISKSNG